MFADAGDVTDRVVAGFDCAFNVTLKVKISVKGHPKILSREAGLIELLRMSTGSQELNCFR